MATRILPPAPDSAPVTWGTELSLGGKTASTIVLQASYDIERVCSTVLAQANNFHGNESIESSCKDSEMRLYLTRIKQLNSTLMSYLDGGDNVSLKDAYRAVYGETPTHDVEAA